MFTDLRPFVGFMTGPDWLLALLVVGIGAPLSEELLFRGFLLSALAGTRFGLPRAPPDLDGAVDVPARQLHAARHRRGLHDRAVLLPGCCGGPAACGSPFPATRSTTR
jgi:hypothetical protein